ncbi:MAG: sulfotransferase [Candidatus Algichlamydia australiensis]|nr:sulfotransferase [Chlamydiales bacterium]
MKKFALFFCMPLLIMAYPAKYADIADAEECIFVLSEQKSGVNWLTSSLQFLTRRPICPPNFNYKDGMNNRLKVLLDERKPPFVRVHSARAIAKTAPEKNSLILIYRDYKENTIRMRGAENYKKALSEGTLFNNQAKNLAFFDRWPEERRHLVYYEDLILSPKETLEKVLDFLGEDHGRVKKFMKNLSQYQQMCLASYDKATKGKKFGQSQSKGADLHFHSKKVSKELLLEADEIFKDKYPYLWDKYLSHYETE